MLSRFSGRLHRAAAQDNPHLVSKFICLGTDINARNFRNETPLHVASGQGEAAKKLLQLGADPFVFDCEHNTPLHTAAKRGNLTVTYLLSNYMHPRWEHVTNTWGETPLHLAAAHDHAGLGFLLRFSDMDAQCHKGETPLHVAARNAQPLMTHFLLSMGSCPLTKDRQGKTPLDLVPTLQKNNNNPQVQRTFGLLEKFRL